MTIREPAVAGMFYPADKDGCRRAIVSILDRIAPPTAEVPRKIPDRIIGGVVPHAGWVCSGAVACRVILEIAQREHPDIAVIFGAVHVPHEGLASIDPSGAWRTPLGLADIERSIVEYLRARVTSLEADPAPHRHEHSIEVEVPFIQQLLPAATIVPIMIQADERAANLGATIGEACCQHGVRAVFLASTDLTHYGPAYGFTPQGVGPDALRWAKETNDRRMIDLMLEMREGDALGEAKTHRNACGAGAIAATVSACKAFGASPPTLLEHTTSHEVLRSLNDEPPRDAVGYAGMVFHD